MSNIIAAIQLFIAQGKIEKAIQATATLTQKTENEQITILISQDFRSVQLKALSGLITDEEERTQKTKIAKRILDLLDHLKTVPIPMEYDGRFNNPFSMKNLIYALAAGLAIVAVGYLYGWFKAEPDNREPLPALLLALSSLLLLFWAMRSDAAANNGGGFFNFNKATIKGNENKVRQATQDSSTVGIQRGTIEGDKNDVEQGKTTNP